MDYVTWDKITPDGSWGRYTSVDAPVATAEAGRAILTALLGAIIFTGGSA